MSDKTMMRFMGKPPGLNQDLYIVLNPKLDILCCPTGEAFVSDLKFFLLILHIDEFVDAYYGNYSLQIYKMHLK